MTENAGLPLDTTPASGSTEQSVEQQPRSVDEVEAFWRNRFSARDKAHNAEVAALKAQMDAASKGPQTPREGETPEQARIRELEATVATEQAARKVEALRARYPFAVATLGDTASSLAEEKLAALEALGGGEAPPPANEPPVIDPNAAPRRPTGVPATKPQEEKSKDELLADLKGLTPAYQQALRDR